MKVVRALSLTCVVVVLLSALSTISAQTWTPLTNLPPNGADNPHLLTDGRVMVQGNNGNDWWALTPDAAGSYLNGTWSQLASGPSDYCPLYYPAAVLADGRFATVGGEYNSCGSTLDTPGAVYNPKTDSWSNFAIPGGPHWNGSITGYGIIDSASVVLANGDWLITCAGCGNPGYAAFNNGHSLSGWHATGSGKLEGGYDEEGLILLPSGKVLTVGVYVPYNSQLYDPSTGTWGPSINTVVDFTNPSAEIGPAVLRPDGTVFQAGGVDATGANAVFNTSTNTWSAAPSFPVVAAGQLDIADGPAAILPNGNVLLDASPGYTKQGTYYFEWDGTSLNPVPGTPNSSGDRNYEDRMLVLPTGEIYKTGAGENLLYTTAGTYDPSWVPTITSFEKLLHPGDLNRTLSGTQLNGLSQGGAYGDDVNDSTNYPLVRITNNASGHVFYCRTHNHSSMGVATGSLIVSTLFDVPVDTEFGASQLVVVANGIPSQPVNVKIIPPVKNH